MNNLGTVHNKLGEKAAAMSLFEKAVILRPNYAMARYNLAEAYEPTNPKRALAEYETFLALVEGIPEGEDRPGQGAIESPEKTVKERSVSPGYRPARSFCS